MPATATINVKIEPELKREAEDSFADVGLTMSAAVVPFLRQTVRRQEIPFPIRREAPNAAHLEAAREGERIARDPNVKGYMDVKSLREELLA